jgi:peptidoglycan/LPS O-acetylase OafA/YrhL
VKGKENGSKDASASSRLLALEGLRGIAAIVVVIYHAILIFYMTSQYGTSTNGSYVQHLGFEDNLYGNPLQVFLSGGFAVSIFFVLSGFVLTVGYLKTKDVSIIHKLATKRYIRLMLPALASILLTYIVLALNLNTNQQAGEAINSYWLQNKFAFDISLVEAFKQGVWGIFVGKDAYYNPVLWTMFYEMLGSFLVFAVAVVFSGLRKRWVVYAILALCTFQTWFFGFIIGLVLADLYVQNSKLLQPKKWWAGLTILIGGLLLGGIPVKGIEGTLYDGLKYIGGNFDWYFSFYTALGAGLVIIAILSWRPLERLFAAPQISNLGKYTFALYLTHYIVLFSFSTGLFTSLFVDGGLAYNHAFVITVLVSAPLLALAAYIFERYVDAPSIKLSSRFAAWFLGKKKTNTSGIKKPTTDLIQSTQFENQL